MGKGPMPTSTFFSTYRERSENTKRKGKKSNSVVILIKCLIDDLNTINLHESWTG
jgi:hypothetical protein